MIKVFLVDDEIVIREGIRNSFPWEEYGYTLVGEAPDGEIALPMIRDANPDILITDIRMPFMDGMELCREVKRQMPWVGIIILSGFDDFAYAREAISLGVQEYMLKPISAKELRDVLDRVSRHIKENIRTLESIERKRRSIASGNRFLQEKLLSSLFSDDMEPGEMRKMNEQMRALGINLTANCYTVVEIAFEMEDGATALGKDAIFDLAENNRAIYCCSARFGARALVLGDSKEDTEERAYAFANSVCRELERIGADNVLLTIGEFVDEFSDIPRAMQSARHTRHVAISRAKTGIRIIGVHELDDAPTALSDLTTRPLYELLQYTSPEELPKVFRKYIASLGAAAINVPVVSDYIHVEAVMTAGRIVSEAGGNPDAVLDNIWKEVPENPEDHTAAMELLRQALVFRAKENPRNGRSAVDLARSYLAQNFSNPNLMLQDVAREVNMSNSHFSTVFSQETGFTFTEYLTALRIGKAKELLCATDMRSSKIAFEVGYNDPHYFSYMFKKNTGCTPSDYRREHQSGSGAI